jgi:hypothetical protein
MNANSFNNAASHRLNWSDSTRVGQLTPPSLYFGDTSTPLSRDGVNVEHCQLHVFDYRVRRAQLRFKTIDVVATLFVTEVAVFAAQNSERLSNRVGVVVAFEFKLVDCVSDDARQRISVVEHRHDFTRHFAAAFAYAKNVTVSAS